jgi:hypothetical protein
LPAQAVDEGAAFVLFVVDAGHWAVQAVSHYHSR